MLNKTNVVNAKFFSLVVLSAALAACGGDSSSSSNESSTKKEQQSSDASKQVKNAETNKESTSEGSKTSTSSAKGTCNSETKEQILAAINKSRSIAKSCGNESFPAAEPLVWSDALELISRQHSEDMASKNFFSHTGSDGSEPKERAIRNGYSYLSRAENVAAGRDNIIETVKDWEKSPKHCASLMSAKYTENAVVCVYNPDTKYKWYWTHTLGKPTT